MDLFLNEIKYFKDDEVAENITKGLEDLLEIYKFSLETMSIFTHIDLIKLNNFYLGKDGLTYDELNMITSTILIPFMGAIDAAKHNYVAEIKSRGSNKIMKFIDAEN